MTRKAPKQTGAHQKQLDILAPTCAVYELRYLCLQHEMQMPEYFSQQWNSLGFTHIHISAVQIALTYQGRKGRPVVEHLYFIDTRFNKYQHASLGTSEIILDNGTVFVMMFPNFNIPLADPYLMRVLKIQVQILNAPQDRDASQATLHCQIAYFMGHKYEELRSHPQPLKTTDDFNHHYLKRPPRTTFYIPMYNPSDDISDVKDPDDIRLKSALAAPQYAILIRALKEMLWTIQSEQCPLETPFLSFLAQQCKEITSLKEEIQNLKYDCALLKKEYDDAIKQKTKVSGLF
ncbi:hypothetical protein FXO38_35507 [Capsicum annuum]|nr:hypothetical protein FXO38_35507 [Capsicum annuum]